MNNYQPPRHIWDLIKDQVAKSELQEVKNIVGESLIDHTKELRREIELLLEIWKDVKEKQLNSNRLPEAPVVRELLTRDIQLFISNLRDKMLEEKKNTYDLMRNDVLGYVLNETGRGRSAEQGMGFLEDRSIGDNECAESEDLKGLDLSSLKDQYTSNFEDMLEKIRNLMKDEIDQLKEDILYIQESLENDSQFQIAPSIADLRKTRAQLERVAVEIRTDYGLVEGCRRSSFRRFLLESDDHYMSPPSSITCPKEDEGFSSPVNSPSISSTSSAFQLQITSFPAPSLSSPSPLASSSSSSSSSSSFPSPRSGQGPRAVPPHATEHVTIRCSSSFLAMHNNQEGGPRNLPEGPTSSSSPSSSSSSSSTSGIFSIPNASSSSSSSLSSSASGRISSLQRKMDLLLSYRK